MKTALVALFAYLTVNIYAQIDLGNKLPENYDWVAYVSQSVSVSEEMIRAQDGVRILQDRFDTLSATYRKQIEDRAGSDAVKLFDEMQDYQKKATEAEIRLIGDSWKGGSGLRAEIPKAHLGALVRRISSLQALRDRCLYLQQ